MGDRVKKPHGLQNYEFFMSAVHGDIIWISERCKHDKKIVYRLKHLTTHATRLGLLLQRDPDSVDKLMYEIEHGRV